MGFKKTAAAIASLAFVSPSLASAQSVWEGNTSTSWGVGSNWSGSAVPIPSANVLISNGSLSFQPLIAMTESFTANRVSISAGKLDVRGNLTVLNGVQVTGTGTLAVFGDVIGNVSNFSSEVTGVRSAGGTIVGNVINGRTFSGFGEIRGTVDNLGGTLRSELGTLSVSRSVIGGTLEASSGSALALGANSRVEVLNRVGSSSIKTGEHSIEVAGDYLNSGFGTGSSFNARAGIVGTGPINANSAFQRLSGTGLFGGNGTAPTLDLGVMRLGDLATRQVTIHNEGMGTVLRGAVFGDGKAGHSVSGAESFAISPRASTSFNVGYAAVATGNITPSTVRIVNNFDNVADQALSVTGFVNNRAVAGIFKGGSLLAFDAFLGGYVFDFGAVAAGSVVSVNDFAIGNIASGPADLLSGMLGGAAGVFGLASPFNVVGLDAGRVSSNRFSMIFDTSNEGSFTGRLQFDGVGTNRSDLIGEARFANLHLRGSVVVPEPGSLALVITGGLGVLGVAMRRRRVTGTAWHRTQVPLLSKNPQGAVLFS